MRHTLLTNIGFVKKGETYYNAEVHVTVWLDPNSEDKVIVKTDKGNITATIEELEDTIVGGGFGDF
jgi:hypothetical protein